MLEKLQNKLLKSSANFNKVSSEFYTLSYKFNHLKHLFASLLDNMFNLFYCTFFHISLQVSVLRLIIKCCTKKLYTIKLFNFKPGNIDRVLLYNTFI